MRCSTDGGVANPREERRDNHSPRDGSPPRPPRARCIKGLMPRSKVLLAHNKGFAPRAKDLARRNKVLPPRAKVLAPRAKVLSPRAKVLSPRANGLFRRAKAI